MLPSILQPLVHGLALTAFFPALAAAAPAAPQSPPAKPAIEAPAAPAPSFVPPRTIPSSVMKNWPVYSAKAKMAHEEGVVLLSVTISAEGTPTSVKIAKSSKFDDLDVAAVAAVRNWQFTPATRDGVAAETTVDLPINFSLKDAEKAAPPDAKKETKPATAPAAKPKPPKPAVKPAKPSPKPLQPKPAAPSPEPAPPVTPPPQ